ncbi:hypothetical protein EMCRGX_G009369 [Ephydatia muelleri]
MSIGAYSYSHYTIGQNHQWLRPFESTCHYMASKVELCDNDLPSKKLKCPYDRKFNGPFWNNRRYGCWDAGKRHKLCDKCCRRDKCPVCNAVAASKVIPEREPETVS